MGNIDGNRQTRFGENYGFLACDYSIAQDKVVGTVWSVFFIDGLSWSSKAFIGKRRILIDT